MNRWNLGWRASARLRHGLRWQQHAPTLRDYPQAKTYTIRLLMVLAAWCWMMDRDHADQQRQAADAAEARAAGAEQTLLDCMNGRARWITEDGREMVACEPAWGTKL